MNPLVPQTETFQHNRGVIALVFIGGAVALLLGFWLLRSGRRRGLGLGLLFMGLLAEALLGPCLSNDRIDVSPTSYRIRVGFWFAPNEHRFEYKDVEFITDDYRVDAKGHHYDIWKVQFKSGEALKVPHGELWNKHQERIVQLLKQNGVRFQ